MSGEESRNQKSSQIRGCGGSNGSKEPFSRSRALGVIALMLALFIFQVTVFIVNAVKDTRAEKYGEPAFSPDSLLVERFQFNPNTITHDSLCRLGFSPRQAQSILNYRNKGGKFRKKEDFAKMYVVSDSLYKDLSRYIVIPSGEKRQNVNGYVAKRADKPESNDKERFAQRKRDGRYGRNTEKLQKTDSGNVAKALPTEGAERDTLHRKRKRQMPPLVVDINTADTSQLVKLYGIGAYYAEKIIKYRERVGKFYAPEQLMEIDGIDSLRYRGFAKNVKADPSAVRRFRLDTAGKHFLMNHPYIGAYAARGIMLMREKLGTAACTLGNLVKEKILDPQMAEKLWYYIEE